jgi:hypothetical protein
MQNGEVKQVQTAQSGKIKGRAFEIYLDLCRYVDNLPPGSLLPSLRELQRRYTASQQTIVAVLDRLAETRSLQRQPRRKIRLNPIISAPEVNHHTSHLRWLPQRNVAATLGLDCSLAPAWQPIIDSFNQSSSRMIKPHYVKTLPELIELTQHGNVDFALFHVNPILQGELGNTLPFIELKEFIKTLHLNDFYPALQIIDPDGRHWGIAANLTLSVIFSNRSFGRLPCADLTWQELLPHLRQLKNANPELLYPFEFNSYSTFLLNQGVKMVDPETGELMFTEKSFADSLELLKNILKEGVAPLYSETYYNQAGRYWFENGQVAAKEDWWTSIKIPLHQKLDVLPMPVQKGVARSGHSEFFSICSGSMYYSIAWDFIKFVLSPAIQQFLIEASAVMPIRRHLLPPYLSTEQFEVFAQALEQCTAKLEDYYLPVQLRLIIETGIDRWVRFGGPLSEFLCDIEKNCRQRLEHLSAFKSR